MNSVTNLRDALSAFVASRAADGDAGRDAGAAVGWMALDQ